MKVIALLPFKNEELILPTYLSSMTQIADQIIAIDDGSTDNSRAIVEAAGGLVIPNSSIVDLGWAEESIRNNLLKLGRENGGTHFISLDADEAFTFPFVENSKKYLNQMNPGQILYLQFLALWKSNYYYRNDNSVWSNNFKDFIFCDDGISNYDSYGFMHTVRRTPGKNNLSKRIIVPVKEGAVLHFQFANWSIFQIKQSLYRCWELIDGTKNAVKVNASYSMTLDDPKAIVEEIPKEWFKGLTMPNDSTNMPWHFQAVFKLFQKHGIEFFEQLEIWHVSEFKDEFIKQKNRVPKSRREFIGYAIIKAVRDGLKRKVKFLLYYLIKLMFRNNK